VIALHTHWPVLPDLFLARDAGLRLAAARARDATMPTLLAGDLNLTPYAPEFSRLEQASRLRDAFAGRPWRPTWQAGFWPLALPIDHVFVPEGVCVVDARIGPAVGSDHRPVIVTLQWR
jgi:endonuclease/exonuclease/phosphatase (EEP) superfamily protein YafD